MKKFKSAVSVFLALILAFSLCACNDKPQNDPSDGPTPNPPTDEPAEYLSEIEFVIPDGTGTLKAKSDVQKYVLTTGDNMISLTKEEDLTTYFKVLFIKDGNADVLSPSFIDIYVKPFQNLEFPGTVEIGEDGYYSEMVIGSDDTQYSEAYLINTDGGVLAMVLSVSSENSAAELPLLRLFAENFTLTK